LKHDPSDAIVGSYALFPRRLVVNGTPFQAYICGDLIVDTKHRSLGPAVSLVKAAIAKCEADKNSILFGFPNEFSAPVILMSGFKQLSERIKLTKVLRTYPYLQRHLKYAGISKTAAYPIDILLSIRFGRTGKRFKNLFHFDVISSFDERFDRLFEKTVHSFALKGEPSRDYLNWRFMDSPYEKNLIFTMESKLDKSLSGYIVFCSNQKRCQIVDLGFIDPQETLKLMLSAFHCYQKSQKAEAIAFDFAGDAQFMNQLLKSGFSVRSRELKTIIYPPSGLKHMVDEIQRGCWYLTAGDNDV